MSIIATDLEKKCRRIARKISKQTSEATPITFIGHEMALVLDHIEGTRERRANQRKELLGRELDLSSQVLNIEQRIDLIPNRIERMRLMWELKHSLERIMMAAQRLAIETDSVLQHLQVRLLKLWNMYDQLSIENGDSQDTT